MGTLASRETVRNSTVKVLFVLLVIKSQNAAKQWSDSCEASFDHVKAFFF
jgi:hypothetical protein